MQIRRSNRRDGRPARSTATENVTEAFDHQELNLLAVLAMEQGAVLFGAESVVRPPLGTERVLSQKLHLLVWKHRQRAERRRSQSVGYLSKLFAPALVQMVTQRIGHLASSDVRHSQYHA